MTPTTMTFLLSGLPLVVLASTAGATSGKSKGFDSTQLIAPLSWGGDSARKVLSVLDRMRASDTGIHRVTAVWGAIEDTKGKPDWVPFEGLVTAAAERGFQVLVTATGSPAWAHPAVRPCADKFRYLLRPDKEYLADWRSFAGQVVSHTNAAVQKAVPSGVFPDGRPAVLGYEIWNEENSPCFWASRSDGPDEFLSTYATEYPAIYNQAAKAMLSADPRAPIGVGGLAESPPRGPAASEFYSKVYRKLARRPDFVGYHPYAIKPYCNTSDLAKKPIAQTSAMLELARLMNKAASPIWITEWAFPSETYAAGTSSCSWTEAKQARLIRAEYEYLDALGAKVRYSIYFHSIDAPADDGPFTSDGILRFDLSPKRSYGTWSSLGSEVSSASGR